MFVTDLQRGWLSPARGDQVNVWGAETLRCADGLEALREQLPEPALRLLAELFCEVGRLCRDAAAS